MHAYWIDADGLRNDPATLGALKDGRLQVLPAEFWQQFTQAEIGAFCVKHGYYCLPTVELVEWLKERIAGRRAIEIGAGSGVLAEALGIPATDNRMQEWAGVRVLYQTAGQTPVPYGEHVEQMDALVAVKRYKPDVVIAAWVTHRYNPKEHWREGNQWGVEERDIAKRAEYIHIGNRHVHRHKPLLGFAHDDFEAPWLVSRAMNGAPNFIAVWNRQPLLALGDTPC